MVKQMTLYFEDKDFYALEKLKNGLSWKAFILKEILDKDSNGVVSTKENKK